MELFPHGILHYAIGGLLIGLGITVIYLSTGIISGASLFLESTLSYISKLPRIQSYADSRDWRVIFVLGIVCGAVLFTLLTQQALWTTAVQGWRLLLGGILVGFGTRLARGCTSGHGVCGLGSLSSASLVNVLIFMGVAILIAQVVQVLGVTP
ncbi:YeeE/YedE family protein [Candidatus Acetothermia bacterium]|nr:YeeE/YedE family protein [Candidatus Acetothermia bacterium]MBI3643944.1 YeeE/YedE family protein [Candidatus Acetothermia bacterium]